MKYLLLLTVFITSLSPSCNYNRHEEIQYDIYSRVLEKKFGHFPQNVRWIIHINDSIRDFKEELETLIYSVQNNELFFKEYCNGDYSFKDFILAIKPVRTDNEIINLERFKERTKINITLDKLIKRELWHNTINFSKIVFNKNKDKAILFITGSSSGSWVFVELVNKKWVVQHEILSRIT